MTDDLPGDWSALCRSLGVCPDCESAGKQLLAWYDEEHRAYHNREHLRECLALFAPVRAAAAQPKSVEVALWFHDAVYDPRASDNEERSAALAREFCQDMRLPPAFADRAAELIMFTTSHLPGEDADAQLLVDIDLGILGKPRDRFARYEAAIRQEYGWVPDETFRTGRAAVLRKFLSREWIYSTGSFLETYETSARANLNWALSRLEFTTGDKVDDLHDCE